MLRLRAEINMRLCGELKAQRLTNFKSSVNDDVQTTIPSPSSHKQSQTMVKEQHSCLQLVAPIIYQNTTILQPLKVYIIKAKYHQLTKLRRGRDQILLEKPSFTINQKSNSHLLRDIENCYFYLKNVLKLFFLIKKIALHI